MRRRKFLQNASILGGSALVLPIIGCNMNSKPIPGEPLKNWSGNLTFGTTNVGYPDSVEATAKLVAGTPKLRPLGSRHSFNEIANSKDALICSTHLKQEIGWAKHPSPASPDEVTVGAGITYGDLAPGLDKAGFALHNLASLPHITVGGAISTGTHGSGVKNKNLSSVVSAIEFIDASGNVQKLSRKDDSFNGAVVALGALGPMTAVTLELVPTFQAKQVVYQDMPIAELEKNLDAILGAGYSVSLFTDWRNKNINEVWVKQKADAPAAAPELFGAKLATKNLHPISTESAENVTDQLDKPGPWYERLPHFKMGFKPSAGKELQAEFFVPYENAYAAIMAVESLNASVSPHLFITEIRTIAKDELWMSPCYKKDCVAIHFTWKQDTEAVMALLPQVEAKLSPFGVRPHWGKLFTMAPAVLQSRIERLKDFKDLVARYDPHGKFRNDFLQRNLY